MSSIFHHDNESGEIETADAISLDEYISISGIDSVDMIKIDIEGAELFALKGMEKTIISFKPIIMMEVSEELLNKGSIKSSDILEFMNEHGYQADVKIMGIPDRLVEHGSPKQLYDEIGIDANGIVNMLRAITDIKVAVSK